MWYRYDGDEAHEHADHVIHGRAADQDRIKHKVPESQLYTLLVPLLGGGERLLLAGRRWREAVRLRVSLGVRHEEEDRAVVEQRGYRFLSLLRGLHEYAEGTARTENRKDVCGR